MAVATAADVAAALGRDLTTAEQARLPRLVQAAVGVLEGVLHRTLELAAWVETYEPIGTDQVPATAASGWSTIGYGYGTIHLGRRPVAAVTKVTQAGTDITGSVRRSRDVLYLPTLEPVEVEYMAGDDPVAPQVVDAVANVAASKFMVPAMVAAGTNLNYSVEGTSVTYGDNTAGDRITYGSFPPDVMAGLRASLGRIVVR